MEEPFDFGAAYRVRESFVALRDRFSAGEVLVYWKSAYSFYDGMQGYFFRQPGTTQVRSWDVSSVEGLRPWEHLEVVAPRGPVIDAVAAGDLAALAEALVPEASPIELLQRELALERAAETGLVEAMEAILGALQPDGELDERLLRAAAAAGQAAAVRLLLGRGVDPRHEDGAGQTPLVHAACSGDVATVRALLEAGADPAARTSSGTTARALAAARHHDDVVRLLDGWPRR